LPFAIAPLRPPHLPAVLRAFAPEHFPDFLWPAHDEDMPFMLEAALAAPGTATVAKLPTATAAPKTSIDFRNVITASFQLESASDRM